MDQITPMMRQYLQIKQKLKDTILFFRLGDFYEMFFDDAKIASKILGITLTSRGTNKGDKVPLAGIPYHAAESYISRLIKAGKKVAICEQVEDPKLAKGIVKREIVRTITPGTVLSPALLEDKIHNYLAAINKNGHKIGFSFIDPSTGEFKVTELSALTELLTELTRITPKECLIPNSLQEDEFVTKLQVHLGANEITITFQDDWIFNHATGLNTLCELFGTSSLEGFGCENLHLGITASGAIIHYLKETQKSALTYINRLVSYSTSDFMILDAATLRNLELTKTIRSSEKTGSLIWVLDKTATAMGGRLLRNWIYQPLINVEKIIYRQQGVAELVDSTTTRNDIAQTLKNIHDIERLISRLDTGLANARDLVALKESLKMVPEIKGKLNSLNSNIIKDLETDLEDLKDITELIEKVIVDSPPLSLRDGGLIKEGYFQELDELRALSKDVKSWIARLARDEIKRTKINSLKVGYNKVFGYYIEVTNPNLHLVPQDYIRKQTLTNAERFITPELKEWETKILNAQDKIVEIEYEIFLKVRLQIIEEVRRIQKVANAIALLDVLLSLAQTAVENDYVLPKVNDSQGIFIKDGRHPVVEKLLSGERFVPNDTLVDAKTEQILIITGPNMAGKSTYIRQVALIVLMAQIGSFIPATEATIGIVDRIFTRVGASDELAKGQSTFMVEMVETANILNNATPKSLLILDEVGRGTSTFDGVSIAWAVAEYLHNNPQVQARTLFATHYHELTELEFSLERVKNYNIAVKEWNDKIIFLRKIVKGGTDRSYGIHVAQLAGLPQEVITRATEILSSLEMSGIAEEGKPTLSTIKPHDIPKSIQLTLFEPESHRVVNELKEIDLNKMSPLEALNKLNEFKKMVE
ncbi:MAG: DNA mismatch repair protein MutS [Nitrospirota bacterium]